MNIHLARVHGVTKSEPFGSSSALGLTSASTMPLRLALPGGHNNCTSIWMFSKLFCFNGSILIILASELLSNLHFVLYLDILWHVLVYPV